MVKEGDPGDAMFIIKEGEVQVRQREGRSGIERFVTTLHDGDCFGEIGLLTGRLRNASIATLLTTELYVLEESDLQGLMQDNAAISASMSALRKRIEGMAVRTETETASLQDVGIQPSALACIPKASRIEHRIVPISLSARVIRAFLRQDPDIILAGETRDREAANYRRTGRAHPPHCLYNPSHK
jgi:CRP-like cAMP-binding protein